MLRHLQEIVLAKLIFKDLYEFWVDFHSKLLDFVDCRFKICLRIASELFHLFIPGVFLAKLTSREYHCSGGELRWFKSQERSI